MTREADIQFVAVEKGIIFGWTISGMYNHTTGPRDTPKTAIYRNKPRRIKSWPASLLNCLSNKNPRNSKALLIAAIKVPNWRIVFLPKVNSKNPVAKVPRTCSKLRRDGMRAESYPSITFWAMSPPYMTKALIPDICWRAATWIAIATGILLFDLGSSS